ncbi:PotD/PotF family extracellular solute-binding protein [Natrinema sp. 74]|uniref:ABC transporter substrate-binding protein n=1 Tax=Natrinema sp. 74 TaxID=3384159 RepID=UPI0038D4A140
MPADPDRVAETSESTTTSATDAAAVSASRRQLLTTTAVGSVTALAGCAKLLGSDPGLRVAVWSGNYSDRFEKGVVSQWEEEHDIEIQLQPEWAGILNKIRSAPKDNPPFDLTVAEGNFYYYGRQDDLFEPIRTKNVPNAEEIMDFYTEIREPKYGMPVDGAPCTIIHRDAADVQPGTWSEFNTAATDTAVGIDTGFWWYPLYAAAIAMDAKPSAEEMYDASLHEDVLSTIEGWNIESWASSGADIWQAFDNGVIDAAQWYYDQTAYDIDDYDGLSHTMPEQTTGWLNNWCVVRGTDKRDEAEKFINFLLDSEVQSEWSQHHPMMFSNRNIEYAKGLEEDLPTTTEEAENIAFPDWSYLADYSSDLSDAFTSMQQQS